LWKSEGYRVFAQDEAIVSLNPCKRRLWTEKGSRPVQLVNGSHKNACFFGAVSDIDSHCWEAEWIDEDSFIEFALYLMEQYEKVALITDRATHHFKSEKVKRLVKELDGSLILWPLPRRLPELNPMEQGWKSARQNVTWKLFHDSRDLVNAVKSHITCEFRMDLFKFWG